MSIRVFEAFSGVGSQRMALRNLGISHEVVAVSDVDEFTVKSYAAIHDNDKTVPEATDEEMQEYLEKRNIPLNDKGVRKILKGKKLKEFYDACIKSNNLGDISKVETHDIPDHDLFTYSFPCQDISVAGKGSGLDEGSDTRSGLLWECQKVIYGKRPKYLLLENVKNLVGKKHKHNFDKWLKWLEGQGYTNYWQVLNAKDYGVPQNRERVFVVSILGHHDPYEFPEAIELELRLKDVLEDEVDEKFYLSKEKSEKLISKFDLKDEPFLLGGEQKNQAIKKDGISTTLTSSMGMGGGYVPMVNRIGGIFDKDGTKHQAGAVWDKDQISPTLDTMQGGWRQPSIITHNYTEQVKVRKHEVDADALRDLLRSHKQSSGKTNREISEYLDEPMSLVEHWFRNDDSFAIPKEDKWLKLKEILSISTDSFDKQIMEFEIRDGVFDQANRAYDSDGISPTITATDGDKKVLIKNATDSKTVQKDNYVVVAKEEYGRMGRQAVETLNENDVKYSDTINPFNKRISSTDGISPTLTTRPEGFKTAILPISKDLRIRKLSPLETWRLMGFSDDDFHKAEEVNSDSQLYKQAGNSIVVDVLEAIFEQLLEV